MAMAVAAFTREQLNTRAATLVIQAIEREVRAWVSCSEFYNCGRHHGVARQE